MEYHGIISKIDNAVNPVSKTLEVEVQFRNIDSHLKSGMFGEFFIETEKVSNSVIIPEDALQSRTEVNVDKKTGLQNSIKKYFLFMVDSSKAKLVEVSTGVRDDGRVEITSGLGIGDSIVVVGQNIVKAGQKVKVID